MNRIYFPRSRLALSSARLLIFSWEKRETIMAEKQRLLELALKGLEAERAKIDDEIAQIRSQLNHGTAAATATAGTSELPKKKTMSAAARKKISEAMKRRY